MIIKTMSILNRNKEVETFLIVNKPKGDTFKDKFVKIHFLNEEDREKMNEMVANTLTFYKSAFKDIEISDNPTEEEKKEKGLKDNYWLSKERVVNGQKYNARFFVRHLIGEALPF